jgi:hypothetical protein
MKGIRSLLVLAAAAAILLSPAGCGSKALQYAKQARSSYVSARAVLAGLQEFPSQMEELLRSRDLDGINEKARGLFSDARDLMTSATTAFRACKEKCEQLKAAGSEKFNPYADKLLELVDLNGQVINGYSELIGLSNSVLENIPYSQDPGLLMPTLNYLDSVTARILKLMGQVHQLEDETESLYRTLTE